MKLYWGTTLLGEDNGTKIAPVRRLVMDGRMRGWAFDHTYTADGFFRCSGQADCKTKMDALAAAVATPAQDLLFKNDDGSSSHNSVLTADTLGGTRCTMLEWLPDPRGAQFTTSRYFRLTFEYRVLFSGLTGKLLDFSETVELDLQPKKYAVNEAVNNVAPEILLTVNQTPARASQTGFAVGATGYPDPAVVCPDTFAGAGIYKTVDVVRRVSPKARGSAASAEEFRIEWRKEFVSASALTANPAPWPAGT